MQSEPFTFIALFIATIFISLPTALVTGVVLAACATAAPKGRRRWALLTAGVFQLLGIALGATIPPGIAGTLGAVMFSLGLVAAIIATLLIFIWPEGTLAGLLVGLGGAAFLGMGHHLETAPTLAGFIPPLQLDSPALTAIASTAVVAVSQVVGLIIIAITAVVLVLLRRIWAPMAESIALGALAAAALTLIQLGLLAAHMHDVVALLPLWVVILATLVGLVLGMIFGIFRRSADSGLADPELWHPARGAGQQSTSGHPVGPAPGSSRVPHGDSPGAGHPPGAGHSAGPGPGGPGPGGPGPGHGGSGYGHTTGSGSDWDAFDI